MGRSGCKGVHQSCRCRYRRSVTDNRMPVAVGFHADDRADPLGEALLKVASELCRGGDIQVEREEAVEGLLAQLRQMPLVNEGGQGCVDVLSIAEGRTVE